MLVWLPDMASYYMVLPFVSVPRIHYEKAEAAYCSHRLGHRHSTAWCSCTLQSYTLVQFTYHDEVYGECKVTACTCTNSGYQTILSNVTECLGTRLVCPLMEERGMGRPWSIHHMNEWTVCDCRGGVASAVNAVARY